MKKIDKQLSYAPAEFQVSYCGWASPAMREMNGIFRQQLALLCYDQAKSVEELSESLQTPYEYIQDALDSFCKAKIFSLGSFSSLNLTARIICLFCLNELFR